MFANLKQKGAELSNKAHRFFLPTEVTTIGKSLFTTGMFLYAVPMTSMAGINDMFSSILGAVFQIFFYVGALLLAWSIGQLILAFKNEDADSKSRAVLVIVVSCLLLSSKQIYNSIIKNLGNEAIKAGNSPLTD